MAYVSRYLLRGQALLGWYLNDELGVTWMPDLEAHYQWTAAADPDHVAWSVLFEAPQLSQYLGTFDVIGTDPYPINAAPGTGQPAKVSY